MTDLSSKKCVACEAGGPSLDKAAVLKYLQKVSGWSTDAEFKKISKSWKFADFKSAIAFANKIADVAESEGHHPEITVGWGKVSVLLWTHAVSGLSENDFILAAKIAKLEPKGP